MADDGDWGRRSGIGVAIAVTIAVTIIAVTIAVGGAFFPAGRRTSKRGGFRGCGQLKGAVLTSR
jgi:hypothetical protein